MKAAAILDLIEPEIAPFDPPTPKTLLWNKHEVDRITRCGDIAIRIFHVGRQYLIIILLFATLGT